MDSGQVISPQEPHLKRYERHSNNILQVTRQLNAFSNSQLYEMRMLSS